MISLQTGSVPPHLPVLQTMVRQYATYLIPFATLSGSHAFGCSTSSSDYDVHGTHLLPLDVVLGLDTPSETIEKKMEMPGEGIEIDLATHDLRKFVQLLLKGNGNVLEDLYSPLVVIASPVLDELRTLAQGCITKRLALHYRGMAYNQQRRMKINELKKLLHMYRCLLMGIHLMRTGTLEMHLPTLADEYSCSEVHRLIVFKEQGFDYIPDDSGSQLLSQVEMLRVKLEHAHSISSLPDKPSDTTRKDLEQLVIHVRRLWR